MDVEGNGETAPRLAIVGGGTGGVAAAYFLGGPYKVDLFEARHKLGGHCDSVSVSIPGGELPVDLGAQFFHPGSHPLYLALLCELGLFQEGLAEQKSLVEADASLTIFPLAESRPHFVSTHLLGTPQSTSEFGLFTQAARRLIREDGSWELTLEDWVNALRGSRHFKERVLLPWIAALIGTTTNNARLSSARSILQTFTASLQKNLLKQATTWNARIGFGGIIDAMVRASRSLTLHMNAEVSRLEAQDGTWFLETAAGRYGPYAAIIMNAMPHASRKLVAQLPWGRELTQILDQYEYFDARTVIHTDPVYMPRDERHWAMYNACISSKGCEGSVWLGKIHRPVQGRPLSLFKSWATARETEPRSLLAERTFRHPLITPRVIRAARQLKKLNGVQNLWFSGQHMTGMDLQETALFAAMRVAEELSPESAVLKRFKARLKSRGLLGSSYEL